MVTAWIRPIPAEPPLVKDMNDVKEQLQKHKKENHDMETELRRMPYCIISSDGPLTFLSDNSNAEQKVRLMEVRVAENAETIEQLREERAVLAADHKALQKRFSEISEVSLCVRLEISFADCRLDSMPTICGPSILAPKLPMTTDVTNWIFILLKLTIYAGHCLIRLKNFIEQRPRRIEYPQKKVTSLERSQLWKPTSSALEGMQRLSGKT